MGCAVHIKRNETTQKAKEKHYDNIDACSLSFIFRKSLNFIVYTFAFVRCSNSQNFVLGESAYKTLTVLIAYHEIFSQEN